MPDRNNDDDALKSWRLRTLAAPGINIWSLGAEGKYDLKSGTSQATPMVEGIAARCFAAGECRLGNAAAGGGLQNRNRILKAAINKNNDDPEYRWSQDVDGWKTYAGNYHGNLAWAGLASGNNPSVGEAQSAASLLQPTN